MRKRKRPFFINPENIDLIVLDRATRKLVVAFKSGVREVIDIETSDDLDAAATWIQETNAAATENSRQVAQRILRAA